MEWSINGELLGVHFRKSRLTAVMTPSFLTCSPSLARMMVGSCPFSSVPLSCCWREGGTFLERSIKEKRGKLHSISRLDLSGTSPRPTRSPQTTSIDHGGKNRGTPTGAPPIRYVFGLAWSCGQNEQLRAETTTTPGTGSAYTP